MNINKINFITNTSELFQIYIYVPAGAIYEEKKHSGISHMLEHMMFKNKGKVTSNITKELTRIGGLFNAATYMDVTYYFIKTTSDVWKDAMDIINQITQSTTFNDVDLNTERKVVLEELGNTSDSFEYTLHNIMLGSVLDDNNPYLKSVIGNEKSLKSLTSKDLKDYAKEHYPNYMVFINCDKKILSKVEKYAYSLFGGKTINLYNDDIENTVSSKIEPKLIVLNKNLYNKYLTKIIFLTYPAKNAKEQIQFDFVDYILTTAGLNSILKKDIREKRGLVYGINSYSEVFRYLGLYYIYFSSNIEKTDYILSLIFNSIQQLQSKGITKNELQYYKNSYTNTLKVTFANEDTRTEIHSMATFYGVYIPEKEIYNIIQSTTNQDIIDISKKFLNFSRMGITTVGSYKSVNTVSKNIEDILRTYQGR